MKRTLLFLLLGIAACGGDRHDPEPPSPLDPTEPYPDPVTSSDGIGGFGTTGPVMQNEPSRIAESGDGTTGSGATGTIIGVTGTLSTTGPATSAGTTTASTTGTTARTP